MASKLFSQGLETSDRKNSKEIKDVLGIPSSNSFLLYSEDSMEKSKNPVKKHLSGFLLPCHLYKSLDKNYRTWGMQMKENYSWTYLRLFSSSSVNVISLKESNSTLYCHIFIVFIPIL